MRRSLLFSLLATVVVMAGCPSKPKNGECKTSDDCKEQAGFGKFCVEGRCQECGADTDCQAGFVCRSNKCIPRPECSQDADCGAGKTCQDGRCAAGTSSKIDCESDAQCPSGQACEAGHCAEKAPGGGGCGGEENAAHFGFDRSDLDSDARAALDKVASCLKGGKGGRVVIEGNCDERGTTEYNLHLGERRAESVRRYLVNLGLDPKSVKTTSYGKERPICSESTE
ncbi:MAG TPA: OmpA family protein, partial [Anaeromyxobacteraceae bacterium]|nr:OmpA family protein [Anaeromyxobacteraceae bacterium]